MALILQLDHELEEKLSAEARARGLSLDEYVRTLLEQRIKPEVHRELTLQEFENILDSLAEFSDRIPDLPPEALTREGIYQDHD